MYFFEDPPPVTTLKQYNWPTNDETTSLPSLDPDQDGDTSANDLTDASNLATSCYLIELPATLGLQIQRVDEEKTNADRQISDKALLTELETLMSVARDAIEKATRSSKTAPTDINLSEPNTPERTPNILEWPLLTRPICNTIANLPHLTSTTNEPITVSQANGVTEKLTKKTYCVGTI